MNDTDAGDYKIGDIVAPKSVASSLSKQQQQHASSSASTSGPSFGVSAKLEPFMLLGKNARGASAAALIAQVTAAQGVFVFAELLELPGVKDLATNEQYSSSHRLLELFAYGTWNDYIANQSSLPKLNTAQETKLRQLTLLSLAAESRVISYDTLLSSLALPSVPALEDLLIDAFYSNVLSGRLDQKHSRLEVSSGLGRDVRPVSVGTSTSGSKPEDSMEVDPSTSASTTRATGQSVESLTHAVTSWLSTIRRVLGAVESQLAQLSALDDDAARQAEVRDGELQKVISEVVHSTANKDGKSTSANAGGTSSRHNFGDDADHQPSTRDRGGGSWGIGSVGSGLINRVMGGVGGGNRDDNMEVDAAGPSSTSRGAKSPTGRDTRTRKRGRI